MRGLIARIWLALVALFVVSILAHELLVRFALTDQEQAFEEAWVAPGFRMAVASLRRVADDERDAVTERLAWAFQTDVAVVPSDAQSDSQRADLAATGEHWQLGARGLTVWLALDEGGRDAVAIGPLPLMPAPDLLSRGGLLLLTALGVAMALAVLLRPLRVQHERMEQALADLLAGRTPTEVGPEPSEVGATFDELAARLEAQASAQRSMLHAASHELRTPLSRLRLGLQLLVLSDDPDDRAARREALDRDIAELDALVDELMMYARARAAPAPSPQPVALGPRIHERLARIGGEVALDCHVDVALELTEGAVDRVLDNVLGNSVRYGATRLRVRSEHDADGVHLCFDDDGPGVPEADRLRVLEPFERGSAEQPTGHGLGLAIVQQTARGAGGEVALSQAPLGGLRVVVTFPSQVVADSSRPAGPSSR